MTGLRVFVLGRSVDWDKVAGLSGDAGTPAAVAAAGESPALALAALEAAGRPVAVATAASMTDTLKLVDGAGTVLGTADREHHRLVGTPIAAPLGALRAAAAARTPGELLRLLAGDLDVVPAVR